jgi:hypothetical protein
MLRLSAGDHRREEYSRRQKRRRHPENRQLNMPGAHQVEWKDDGQINAEEVREFRSVMFRGAARQRLYQKQHGHHRKESGAGALPWCQDHLTRRAKRERLLLAPMPT